MASILQGTTPSLEIVISENDFIVTDVTELELTFQNGKTVLKKSLADVTVDAENNSFIYTFTEAETLALSPTFLLLYQLRFMFANGEILGTEKASINVSDLISEAVM